MEITAVFYLKKKKTKTKKKALNFGIDKDVYEPIWLKLFVMTGTVELFLLILYDLNLEARSRGCKKEKN